MGEEGRQEEVMLQAAWAKISQRGGVEGESERKEKW